MRYLAAKVTPGEGFLPPWRKILLAESGLSSVQVFAASALVCFSNQPARFQSKKQNSGNGTSFFFFCFCCPIYRACLRAKQAPQVRGNVTNTSTRAGRKKINKKKKLKGARYVINESRIEIAITTFKSTRVTDNQYTKRKRGKEKKMWKAKEEKQNEVNKTKREGKENCYKFSTRRKSEWVYVCVYVRRCVSFFSVNICDERVRAIEGSLEAFRQGVSGRIPLNKTHTHRWIGAAYFARQQCNNNNATAVECLIK